MAIIEMRLPEYTTTLPITKKNVKYRPFTVKEEKILLLAQEEGTEEARITSVNQIIRNCTFGKFDLDTLNKIDAEFLFLQCRNKSMGEGVRAKAKCENCGEKTSITLDLSTVKLSNDEKKEPIEIADNVWVTMKIPTIKESMMLDTKDVVKSVASVLDTIIDGEEVKNASDYTFEERVDFVESLTGIQLAALETYFVDFPVLALDVSYKCPVCNHENNIHLEGLEDFFV